MSQITHDLVLVARVSRAALPSLESTLAAIVPQPAPDDALKLSQIFVARVARIAAGAAALATTCALIATFAIPDDDGFHFDVGNSMSRDLELVSKGWLIVDVLFVVAIAYAFAARLGGSRFVHRPERSRVDALAWWSVAAPTAGALAVIAFFGLGYVVLGGDPFSMITDGQPEARYLDPAWRQQLFALWIGAIAFGTIGAFVARRLPGWMAWLGGVLVLATLLFGLAFDVGPVTHAITSNWTLADHAAFHPSLPLRSTLTGTGMLGLVLLVGGAFATIRRREDA